MAEDEKTAKRLKDIPWFWRTLIAIEIIIFCQLILLANLFTNVPNILSTGAYWLMAGVASVFFVGSGFTELVSKMHR